MIHKLESILGKYKCFHLHAAMHNAYGRFCYEHGLGPGCCYVNEDRTPKIFKHLHWLVIVVVSFGLFTIGINISQMFYINISYPSLSRTLDQIDLQ